MVPLLQIDAPPVLRPSLHSGAGRPCDARFVDVFARRRVRLVAVVNNDVEPEPLTSPGLHPDLRKRNGRLDAVTAGGSHGEQLRAWSGLLDRPLPGVGIAGRSHG